MSYYFVTNIKIKDIVEYQKYINRVDEVFSKFKGKYLAIDDKPKIVEGNWEYSRVVIIEFTTEKDFNSWYNSKEYQEILKYRMGASNSDGILIKGK
jgi:uncharacterized protein (DUF1330 family)